MGLLQEILTNIEKRAERDTQDALNNQTLIEDGEAVRSALRAQGVDADPDYIAPSTLVFYFQAPGDSIRVRRALNKAGLKADAESVVGIYKNRKELILRGHQCTIWVPVDTPVAKAA